MSAQPVDLSHAVLGPEGGAPVVLLHGFPLSRDLWHETAAALARSGHRVVLPDLRGHGSTPPGQGPATMEAQAADVGRLADRLGLARFVLGGHSMGGYVALEFVHERPKRVAGLVLVHTRAEPDAAQARSKRHAAAEQVGRRGVEPLAQRMSERMLSPATRRDRPEIRERIRNLILATSPRGVADALEGMAARPDQRPRLGAISCPTLVVAGADDELVPFASARALAQGVPDARLETLPDVGHLAMWEAPAPFARLLTEWLATVSGHGPAHASR